MNKRGVDEVIWKSQNQFVLIFAQVLGAVRLELAQAAWKLDNSSSDFRPAEHPQPEKEIDRQARRLSIHFSFLLLGKGEDEVLRFTLVSRADCSSRVPLIPDAVEQAKDKHSVHLCNASKLLLERERVCVVRLDAAQQYFSYFFLHTEACVVDNHARLLASHRVHRALSPNVLHNLIEILLVQVFFHSYVCVLNPEQQIQPLADILGALNYHRLAWPSPVIFVE